MAQEKVRCSFVLSQLSSRTLIMQEMKRNKTYRKTMVMHQDNTEEFIRWATDGDIEKRIEKRRQ